jgi:hypothetical protein
MRFSLSEPAAVFNLDDFQAAELLRRHIFVAFGILRSDRLTVTFSEIKMIFEVSKSTAFAHYQRELTDRQRVRDRCSLRRRPEPT